MVKVLGRTGVAAGYRRENVDWVGFDHRPLTSSSLLQFNIYPLCCPLSEMVCLQECERAVHFGAGAAGTEGQPGHVPGVATLHPSEPGQHDQSSGRGADDSGEHSAGAGAGHCRLLPGGHVCGERGSGDDRRVLLREHDAAHRLGHVHGHLVVLCPGYGCCRTIYLLDPV